MSIRNKGILWGAGVSIVIIILFIAVMTWFYPFSHFSVYKNYTYKPDKVLYNHHKTYEDTLNEFKKSYQEDLNKDSGSSGTDFTVDRTQYILPVFEQDWLIGTDSISMNKTKLDQMLSDVKQSRNILLDLVAEGDYTSEERGYLIDVINNFLGLEESIRKLRYGKYFTRSDLNNLFGNLRNDFRSNFEFFVNNFYERSH